MKLAVSTIAFHDMRLEEIINLARENALYIEYSSGMPYQINSSKLLLNEPAPKLIHNYFPAPKEPFTLNLASINPRIRALSIEHCINNILFSAEINAPFFSAHAGICGDPTPESLGEKLHLTDIDKKETHWKLFIESIKQILEATKHLQIRFLIENNVTTSFNLIKNESPLLCSEPKQLLSLVEAVDNSRFGLLFDTAHWKVSSSTLGFSMHTLLTSVLEHTHCVHHSDNEGTIDSNEPIQKNYWFLTFMSDLQEITHVLEVREQNLRQIEQQFKILEI